MAGRARTPRTITAFSSQANPAFLSAPILLRRMPTRVQDRGTRDPRKMNRAGTRAGPRNSGAGLHAFPLGFVVLSAIGYKALEAVKGESTIYSSFRRKEKRTPTASAPGIAPISRSGISSHPVLLSVSGTGLDRRQCGFPFIFSTCLLTTPPGRCRDSASPRSPGSACVSARSADAGARKKEDRTSRVPPPLPVIPQQVPGRIGAQRILEAHSSQKEECHECTGGERVRRSI